MNTAPQTNPAAASPAAPSVRELSILDAMLEVGVREPAAEPSILDAVLAQPVKTWSRGQAVRFEPVVFRRDSMPPSQSSLFGLTDEEASWADDAAPVRTLHGSQVPFGMVEVDRGSGCCICGDKSCGIGPFVAGGGR